MQREVEPAPPPSREQRPPFPWVTATIMAVAVVVHVLKLYAMIRWPPKTSEDYLAQGLKFGALYGPSVRDGEWWRMITYAFSHAASSLSGLGALLHIGFNLMAASALGVPLERRIGTLRFLQLTFVVCLGSAAMILAFPGSRVQLTVGASGVIFGWAGALLFLLRRAQARELGRLLLLNALISLLPHVSWQGHLGGFLFGLPCGLVLRRDPDSFGTRAPIFAGAAFALAIWGVYH